MFIVIDTFSDCLIIFIVLDTWTSILSSMLRLSMSESPCAGVLMVTERSSLSLSLSTLSRLLLRLL